MNIVLHQTYLKVTEGTVNGTKYVITITEAQNLSIISILVNQEIGMTIHLCVSFIYLRTGYSQYVCFSKTYHIVLGDCLSS